MRKPQVKDLSNLPYATISLRAIYQNKITRAALVAGLTIVGSALGTLVSVPLLFKLLQANIDAIW